MNYRQTSFIAFTGLLCLALAAAVSRVDGPVSGLLLVGLGLLATALTPAVMAIVSRTDEAALTRNAATVRDK